MQDLERSVIRILNAQHKTVGTGFLVADRLAVTCAHVIQAAGSASDQPIRIQFYTIENIQTAQVLTAGWSLPNADDVAFVQLDHSPEGVVPVVLGSAKQYKGHPYHTFGFASLAGYDNRQVNDTLDGIVSVRDKHKHSMLQLKGEEIDQGLSGSPILDTQTDRVVGMISEYKDNARTRFAWATTADTLVDLHPVLQLWPEAYGPKELDLYLRYLIDTNQWLKLPDGHDVMLERIYVSLRAEEMRAIEWKAEHDLYLEDLATARREIQSALVADQYTEFDLIRKAIVRHPKVLKLTRRDWIRLFGEQEQGSLSLAEVIQRHPYVVILGDPGSGKTTLGKWLVLQFARALQERRASVQVHADMVRPGVQVNTLLDLGPVRLPIILRIADYARARWEKDQEDNKLPLDRFLGLHENKRDLPLELTPEVIRALAQAYLIRGQALVVLDGLDEVADPGQRKAVMLEVKRFLQSPLPETSLTKEEDIGNRVLLTSRIVGYQFDPLTDLPHYTVEEMDNLAITSFCQAWIRHVVVIDSSEAVEQAKQLKDAIFNHAYPSVRALAGNPLLLTIMAQVYWRNKQRTLPTRRVTLFEEATRTLYDQRGVFWTRAGISLQRMTFALGAVAAYIHAHEPNGFAEEGQVRKQLSTVLPNSEQVEAVLNAARDVSGFLVARGEGIYGFLHRALQEYFVAQHLVSQPTYLSKNIIARCLESIWREPIVLAMGIVSQRKYPESYRLPGIFAALLDAPDSAGKYLPRRELLAAAACAECERLPPGIGKHIAEGLLTCFAEYKGRVRPSVMHESIRRAFIALYRSPAAAETESVLCSTVHSPDFERRYAAVDLIIETEWASPAIAEALVSAWQCYADPAGSLLVALEIFHRRHPASFTDVCLPPQRVENALLWETAKDSQEWQAVFRILYLPSSAPFTCEQINRDSPLSEYILATLGQMCDSEALIKLQQHLLPLAGQPGTAQARDAALALSVMGDLSWLPGCVEFSKEREYLLRPLIASIEFVLELSPIATLARALELNLPRARALARADTRLFNRARSLADDLAYRAHHLGLTQTLDHLDLLRNLDNPLIRIQDSGLAKKVQSLDPLVYEIERDIQAARRKWSGDANLIQQLDSALESLRSFRAIIDFLAPLSKVHSMLIKAYDKGLLDTPKSLTDLTKPTEVTLEVIATLVDDLVSFDDGRRENARCVILTKRKASILGQSVIERMAGLAEIHADNLWIGTQLQWGLEAIEYDKPDWLSVWIAHASETENTTPALTILSSIRRVSSEAFKMLLQSFPATTPWVKKALLYSLSWLVRLRLIPIEAVPGSILWEKWPRQDFMSWFTRPSQVPQKRLPFLLEQLLSWLDQEIDPTVRYTVINVLGHWREQEAESVAGKILDKLKSSTSETDIAAMYMALARLSAHRKELIESVRTELLKGCPQPSATAALARLAVVELKSDIMREQYFYVTPKQRKHIETVNIKLLSRLSEMLPEPAIRLAALLNAGIDDDLWNDNYHKVLAIAIQMHLELFPDQMKFLLNQLEDSLDRKDWQTSRMALAAVTACMEVMPTALQNIDRGRLESLLVRGTNVVSSHNSRRFALTSLSYLRTVTTAIVPALLAGCQDVEDVQQDLIAAVSRFQSLEGDLLPTLVPVMVGESANTAYAVIQLLCALGTSAAGENARLHEQITEALVNTLKDPGNQREAVISGKSKGKLEDALYTALLKVAGWAS